MARAKTRRRRTLGAPYKVHERRRGQYIEHVSANMNHVEKALGRRDCTSAFNFMAATASAWGGYQVHKDEGGGIDSRANMASNRYHELRDQFVKTCLRTKSDQLGGRRKRRS